VPNLNERITGCIFASRCPEVTDLCRAASPALENKAPMHAVACHYAPKGAAPS
jgi:peptide/nickel transport system ATP-binding protein